MLFIKVVALFCLIYIVSAENCRFIRFENAAEAERRALFERCLLSCDESPRELNPCYNCIIPYRDYGCLLKRGELIGCETHCASQQGDGEFMFCLRRCAQKRRTLKKLRTFKETKTEVSQLRKHC
ncbi:unnamed protein product [Cylicocyclus nassatus]|uniref:Uncharacterized protein n=1 Tax=Cylicocyclus nassatus TaxID=53992 RepID=A0AA36H3G6_CYLNA|nr:unnamed protein product [Cylicocyclus nassatus]